MNIVIAKVGKSILFDSSKWAAIGGDCDAPLYYENLFHHNPDINFYILGKSDFSKINKNLRDRINKHNNVFDMHVGSKEYVSEHIGRWMETYKGKYVGVNLQQYSGASTVWEYINTVASDNLPKIDAGIFFSGPDGTSNIPNSISLSRKPDEIASPLVSLIAYAGLIYEFVNKHQLPYLYICTDPRFYPSRGNDLLVPPKKVLSQFNTKAIHHHYTSYRNTTKIHHDVDVTYDKIETIFLLGQQQEKECVSLDAFFNDEPEQTEFNIVLNEGRPSRYKMLNEFVLKHIDKVDIYGKWTEPKTKTDTRFKGPKPFHQLEDMLKRTKYTFIIPIKKGWVTAKFWEMVYYGIIPFMHPSYDTQNNLEVPDFIRVKDAADLKEKIQYLEDNPGYYKELKEQLQSKLTPDLFDGTYLNKITINALNEMGIA